MKRIATAPLTLPVVAMPWTPSVGNARQGGRGKTLAPEAREALIEALAGPGGEYAARALCSAISTRFGGVRPCVNIRQAGSRHFAALERQLEKYGVPLPAKACAGKVKAPESLLAGAQEGVKAEEGNIALYGRPLVKVKDCPDLARVLQNPQRASRDNHFPAIRAASKPGAPHAGQGSGAVDADEFLRSFGSAGAEGRSRVGKAAQAMRVGNCGAAVVIVQKLLSGGSLTPKQKRLVTGLVAKLQEANP